MIGDGSMTGGMAFEGLNNLGHSGRDCIIILNDNGRSYAPTVSKLGDSLARIRNNPTYMRRQARIEKILQEVPAGRRPARAGHRGHQGRRARDVGAARVLRDARRPLHRARSTATTSRASRRRCATPPRCSGPQVVHVLTEKGRGYAPAENDPIKRLHDMGGAKPGSYTAAFTEQLIKIGEEHPEVVAITAAMPDSTGLLPFGERFPGRMFDVGIAEQHAVTSAAGMAMGGLRPVVAVYSTFLTRAIDQVTYDVGLHGQPVIFCIDRAGITGDDGASHHGVLDMVLLSKVPGMTMFAPSSYQELQAMLDEAMKIVKGPNPGPGLDPLVQDGAPCTSAADEVGTGLKGRKLRSGDDLCIIVVGKMLDAADGRGRGRSRPTACRSRSGTPAASSRSTARCSSTPPATPSCSPSRTACARAASARPSPTSSPRSPSARPSVARGAGARHAVAYIPHGKPDAILADLGLDAAGITASALSLIHADKTNPANL